MLFPERLTGRFYFVTPYRENFVPWVTASKLTTSIRNINGINGALEYVRGRLNPVGMHRDDRLQG